MLANKNLDTFAYTDYFKYSVPFWNLIKEFTDETP